MYFVGKADRRFPTSSAGELHDSDGLLMHTGAGEWIWRPLSNPVKPSVSVFLDANPRGFGLLQRDRNFSDYEDLDLALELRPSYWIEPHEGWGEGRVELVELPTSDETNDNIVVRLGAEAGARRRQVAGLRLPHVTAMTMDQSLTPGGRTVATFSRLPARFGRARSRRRRPERRDSSSIFSGGDLSLLHERPVARGDGRDRLGRTDPAHVPDPQHPYKGVFARGVDVTVDPGQSTDLGSLPARRAEGPDPRPGPFPGGR